MFNLECKSKNKVPKVTFPLLICWKVAYILFRLRRWDDSKLKREMGEGVGMTSIIGVEINNWD